MTDLPHDHDDEIVSAVLDGVASTDERARVETDPRLASRLAELAAVRDAVAAPVAPPDEVASRRLLDAALAAVPETDLNRLAEERRRPSHRGHNRTWTILSVAAVLALVALAVPLLAGLPGSGNGDDEAADSGGDSATMAEATLDAGSAAGDDVAEESGEMADGDEGDGGSEELLRSADVQDLGAHPDIDALVADVEELALATEDFEYSGSSTSADDAAPLAHPMADCAAPQDVLGPALLTGTALVDDETLLVRVWPTEDGGTTIEVLGPASCDPLQLVSG